jgi:hypothetical protein
MFTNATAILLQGYKPWIEHLKENIYMKSQDEILRCLFQLFAWRLSVTYAVRQVRKWSGSFKIKGITQKRRLGKAGQKNWIELNLRERVQ